MSVMDAMDEDLERLDMLVKGLKARRQEAFSSAPVDLRALQKEIAAWNRANFPKDGADEKLIGVGEEFGELCHAHLKMRQGIRGTPEELQAKKVDAVGDIVVFLLAYCEFSGIVLNDALAKVWGEVKERDWAKRPTDGGEVGPTFSPEVELKPTFGQPIEEWTDGATPMRAARVDPERFGPHDFCMEGNVRGIDVMWCKHCAAAWIAKDAGSRAKGGSINPDGACPKNGAGGITGDPS